LLAVHAVASTDEHSTAVVLLDSDGSQKDLRCRSVDAELIGMTGKAGECRRLPDGRWLVGVGSGTPANWRQAGAVLASAARSRSESLNGSGDGATDDTTNNPDDGSGVRLALPVSGLNADARAALVIGLRLGSHRFKVSRTQPSPPCSAELVTGDADVAELTAQVRRASALADATALARDLASAPSDLKTPAWLVNTAADLAGAVPGLSATVWPVQRLTEEGFGGLLAVGGGSSCPPALLQLGWTPVVASPADPRHLVLIGKGITFDTGGISIKPADGMHLMRTDMAGGAAVIGALLAIARLEVPMWVTALVPAAENHVSGSSYRPGDIVRHYDGTTTEVTNTDAEGRMVLADVIGYAVRELAPDLIVDVATLTGAMKVALGMRTGGLLASDDDLADALLSASERAGERLWRMPLLDYLAEEVRSDIADLRQAPSGPGGISAALFLREFTAGLPWAHLDIAGPARCDKAYDEVAIGATGFAARTLVELALGYANR
jgi:leucyl aminopeptidase